MLNFLGRLFGTGIMPHFIALRAVSDLLIALSFLAIPIALLVIGRRRRGLTFPRMFILFTLFILSCGAAHTIDAVTFWIPLYGLDGVINAMAAVVSVCTAIFLFRIIPALINLPSPEALRNQIAERESVEREIRDTNRYLELRVTERTNELERINLRLVESEVRFRNILDGASALIFVKDLAGRYTLVNKAFSESVDLDRRDILGQTDLDLFPADLAEPYRESDKRALDGKIEFEQIGRRNEREIIYFTNKFPLLDFEGKAYAICGMSTDITERRTSEEALLRAHEELRHSEERLRQVMDLVPDMLWSANIDGTNRFISQRYLDYTGYSTKQFDNSGFLMLFHPDDRDKFQSSHRNAVETGDPTELELRIRRRDGVYRWFLSRTVPVWNENFQVEYLIGAVTDIHELKRTEQALRRSNEELEQFAYAAAHDLQEPLRNVSTSLGMLERLISDRITAEEIEWIEKSIQNAIRMQAMVKDLLQYSRAVSDEDRNPETTSAEAALREALAKLNGMATGCGARITNSPLPCLPVYEQHMVLLFQNLIGNSLKYRKPDSSPEVSITAHSNGSEWEFAVADNGIGFDPIYAERIFKVFKRLHNRDEYPGNGIGLAICARIVAHYGGRIWAESNPGKGATFRFTLPIRNK